MVKMLCKRLFPLTLALKPPSQVHIFTKTLGNLETCSMPSLVQVQELAPGPYEVPPHPLDNAFCRNEIRRGSRAKVSDHLKCSHSIGP